MILPMRMFTMNAELLKRTVNSLAKSARKTQAKEPKIYVKTTDDGLVSFYFQNVSLSVERLVAADVQAELALTTSLYLLDTLVSGLPQKENILLQIANNQLEMRWGNRRSKINVPIQSELIAMNEPPINIETIEWRPGTLHGIIQLMAPFCLPSNDEQSKHKPMLTGIQFSNEGGLVQLRAAGTSQYITRQGKMNWFENISPISLNASVLQSIAEVVANDVVVTIGRSKHGLITFKTGNVTCITSPLVATLPQDTVTYLDSLFTKEYPNQVFIDRLEVVELMKRVKIVTQAPKSYVVFEFNDNKITCHTTGKELLQDVVGTYQGDIKAIAVSATQLELAASSFFQNKGTGELIMSFQSFDKPISVTFDGEDRTKVMITPLPTTEVAHLNKSISSAAVTS